MWLYQDYLDVKSDFIPVFSKEADKEQPTTWKFFVPHKSMQDIMHGLIKALERGGQAGSSGDIRSIWVHGAYGTGKTFGSFVVKHLLEDSLEDIEDYFQKYPEIQGLWLRFKALREKNQYLVVYRSSSSHITSSLRLLVEVQEAIKEALRDQGYTEVLGSTLYDTIVGKLSDPQSAFDWGKAFDKHREKFLDFDGPEEVIARLDTGDSKLAEKVAQVLEAEGFLVLDNPDTIKVWIDEVIRKNGLQGIVFIWDEFTDFFINNVPVTSLQELAHATMKMPFYLFLITHRTLDQFSRIDEATRKKLLDRFHNFHFEMSTVTAYQLMSNAIAVKKSEQATWDTRCETLWDGVDKTVFLIKMSGEQVRKEDFRRLVPVHPFSAFLLATISRQFSSSQRTLFKFLKEQDEYAFQWFLKEYPSNDWYWLTPDILWDYFFRDDNQELTEEVRDILSYYRARCENIANDAAKRVFKALMLLMALWRQMPGEPLLKPTRSNLERMFTGTPLAAPNMKKVTEQLYREGIIHSLPSGAADEEYTIPLMTIDQNKLREATLEIEREYNFEKAINSEGEIGRKIESYFMLSAAANMRHITTLTTAHELKFKRERINPDIYLYEIGAVLIFAQEEDQLNEIEKIAAEISHNFERMVYVCVQVPFGTKRWNDWIKQKAHQRYSLKVQDANNAKFYEKRAEGLVQEWLALLQHARLKTYFKGEEREITNISGYEDFISQLAKQIYPFGPENISTTNTLYRNSFGQAGALIGLGVATSIQQPYKTIVDVLKEDGFWDNPNFHETRINHPLSKMKERIYTLFQESSVSLEQIWQQLQMPPFGLAPSPIAITLMGFLLREYAQGYYWSDGYNSFPLNHNKLAELLESVMKGKRGIENITISKMRREDEEFCQVIRDVFRLPAERTSYPAEAKKNLRNYINGKGYPFWALRYAIDTDENSKTTLREALDKLGQLLNVTDDDTNLLNDSQAGEFVKSIKCAKVDLAKVVNTQEKFIGGMMRFIRDKHSKLYDLMQRLDIELSAVMERMKNLMNEDVWLWPPDKFEQQLDNVYDEYALLAEINQLCQISKGNLEDAVAYLRGHWYTGKLPLLLIAEIQDAGEPGTTVRRVLLQLIELMRTGGRNYGNKQALVQSLATSHAQINNAVKNQVGSLQRFMKKFMGYYAQDDEADEIFQKLHNLAIVNNLEEVKMAIRRELGAIGRSRLVKEIQTVWRDISKSKSPAAWSEEHRMPIQWVLDAAEFIPVFEALNSLENQRNEKELEKLKEFLTNRRAEFQVLNDLAQNERRFLANVAGEYLSLVKQSATVEEIKDYIFKHHGKNVYYWPQRLREIQTSVQAWVRAMYEKQAYPNVLQTIDELSEADIKIFLKKMAAEPIIGAKILGLTALRN